MNANILIVFISTFVVAILVVSVAGYMYEPHDMRPIPPEEVIDHNDTNLKVHFIDVEMGNAILISIQNRKMLIDAGENRLGTDIIPYLYMNDITNLDYMIATNQEKEHIGGMIGILSKLLVEQYMDNGNTDATESYETLMHMLEVTNTNTTIIKKGHTIDFHPDVVVEVLNPDELAGDFTRDSVIIKMTYNEISFLFMGNAGFETEKELLDSGYDLDVDFLKVGRYGSKYSCCEQFLDAVNPRYSIIQEGPHEEYISPHPDTLDRLRQKNSVILRNEFHGHIVINTDGKNYDIFTQNVFDHRLFN